MQQQNNQIPDTMQENITLFLYFLSLMLYLVTLWQTIYRRHCLQGTFIMWCCYCNYRYTFEMAHENLKKRSEH